MDLNLEGTWSEMGCHRDVRDADANYGERIEQGDICGRPGNGVPSSRGTILVQLVLRGKRARGESSPNRLGLETHSD